MSSSQMPEKAANFAWVLRSNPIVLGWFKILMVGTFLGILIVWRIDGFNTNIFQKDFLVLKLKDSEILSPQADPNLTHQSSAKTHVYLDSDCAPDPINFAQSQPSNVSSDSPQVPENLTKNRASDSPSTPIVLPWISAEFQTNYSSNLLARWLTPGGEPCKDSRTVDIRVPDLDGNNNIELSTGDVHEFVFQALDDSGMPHCLGGDYFETDLSGEKWKARPPIRDHGNVPIKFYKSASQLLEIRQCKKSDYSKDVWSGRWTRHARNDSCPISGDGRYRCQEPSFPCQHPWCNGPLGLLESNGWVYSSHCSFKLFSAEEAWNCLDNRWIFWWGDSNHCDTIRNILNFILDVHDVLVVPRVFDMNITNPRNPSQVVRFTSIFNGHPNATGNYQGLNSLINPEYRQLLKVYFSQDVVPDTVIMNSGLHDGVYWSNIRSFVGGADYAAAFWAEVVEEVRRRGVVPPEIIYRTTVATGGYARSLAFNPHKMEAFNGVLLDKLKQHRVLDRVIDDFDMTYPWHYDNRCNDGVHYGRAPLKMKWRDGQIGHQYFVDLMLGHVLMNALCIR
ncbi:UNVERIFIED_CONTAM: hypothetical protein Scaly_0773600 [Sesamum calycinum]|uniref:Uncharacterized protein n=1 Tax=Sesamum calycinum TaxID=2727403 RepID=A0AAW2R8U6_9LAMI